MNLDEALQSLNNEQLQAVKHTGTPLLILAGAGAGKTKVITTKIAQLIQSGMPANKILAVTFTNKAAREMKERAAALVHESSQSSIKTFHSFGSWFLRKFYSSNDIAQNFSIYDDVDSASLLSSCFPGTDKQTIKLWQRKISRAKDDFILPDDINAGSPYADIKTPYAAYQKKLRETGNADFGDLILLPAQCLKKDADIKKHIGNFCNVILVDEFQDTNIAQMELLKELVTSKTYLCVVGDDDQSIYKFRGASVSNILSFKTIFENTEIIKLEKNYRSTPEILQVANSIIKNNDGRLGKILKPTRSAGIKPIMFVEANPTMEAARVIELLYDDVVRNKKKYSDWAILYRTNYQSRNFETAFLKEHIPYKVVGSLKFYEREEIKDAISLLRFLLNINDEVAFRRVINKPLRGIGEASQDKILVALNDNSKTFDTIFELQFDSTDIENSTQKEKYNEQMMQQQILQKIRETSLSKKVKTETEKFFKTIFELQQYLSEDNSDTENDSFANKNSLQEKDALLQFSTGLSKFVAKAITLSELAEYHKTQDDISDSQKIANLQELVSMAVHFEFSTEGLVSFLETLSLDASTTADENETDAVTLITVHGTKGLEFNNVVITGLEENIFPITKNGNDADIEEERRLMYVACTRAKNKLFLTAAENRIWAGRESHMEVSRFIDEIDSSLITMRNYQDAYKQSFTNFKKTPAVFPKMNFPFQNSKKDESAKPTTKWKKGAVVHSDDSGFGKIISSDYVNGELVIEVRFESGERKVYMPAYNTASLELVNSLSNDV